MSLYVDGQHILDGNSTIEFDNETAINITCVVGGGHPEPVVALTSDAGALHIQPTSVQSVCRSQSSEPSAFQPDLACSATVIVDRFRVDYITSGKLVTCAARSRGFPDVRLQTGFTPRLTGG